MQLSFGRIDSQLFSALVLVVLTSSCSARYERVLRPSKGSQGLCSFTIVNTYSEDAVVKLYRVSDPRTCVHFVYVPSGDSTTVRRVATDNYVVRYSKGQQWDASSLRFIVNRINYEFDDAFVTETHVPSVTIHSNDRKVPEAMHWHLILGSAATMSRLTVQEISNEEFDDTH